MSKKLKPEERCIKRSISFPPKMWEWIESRKGDVGVASRVVQLAVQNLIDGDKQGNAPAPRTAAPVRNARTPDPSTDRRQPGKIK
jgi:hypothetical protein